MSGDSEASRWSALAAKLATLSPAQREEYERRVKFVESMRSTPREKRARVWSRLVDRLHFFAFVALICIGGAGLFGACAGVVLALVRAGWRAGASL